MKFFSLSKCRNCVRVQVNEKSGVDSKQFYNGRNLAWLRSNLRDIKSDGIVDAISRNVVQKEETNECENRKNI